MCAQSGPFRTKGSSLPNSHNRSSSRGNKFSRNKNRPSSAVEVNEEDFDTEVPLKEPFRCFDCSSYDTCLNLAAVLDWPSFTCKGCNGSINQQLLWQGHQKIKKDHALSSFYNLPPLKLTSS